MPSPIEKVIELVLFRLADGVTREQFLATVDALIDMPSVQMTHGESVIAPVVAR
jgi:hypothetical protein